MSTAFTRTEMLLPDNCEKLLSSASVIVFGVGGVGSFAVEALARSGVGRITLVDSDKVDITNINRQIHATVNTVGMSKVLVMKSRILEINPLCKVDTHEVFVTRENAGAFFENPFTYCVDAVDNITAKIAIVQLCSQGNIPVISCMGAGNKLDPTRFEVCDLFSTSVCPVARVMRRELRARDICSLKVVYSKEEPISQSNPAKDESGSGAKRATPGSVAFVPSVAGLIMAGEVIKDICRQ